MDKGGPAAWARRALRAFVTALPDALLSRVVRHRLPRSANLEVTTACNLSCPLCPTHLVPRHSRFLSVAQVEAVLADGQGALRSVCLHVQGEPTMHPELYELVRRCRKAGVETWFGTHGMHLERDLEELFDSDLDGLSIDIDGVSAEDYQRYRKGGDFERVVAGTQKLLAERKRRGLARPIVQVQMVMFSYNEARLEEAQAFLAALGADRVHLKRPSYEFDLEEGQRRGLVLRPATRARVEKAAADFLEQVTPDDSDLRYSRRGADYEAHRFRDQRLCPQLTRATVLSDGRVVACCMDATGVTSFGQLGEQGFGEIWRSARHGAVIEQFLEGKLSICDTCTLA